MMVIDFKLQFLTLTFTSAALEVEGTEPESTTPSSSTDMLVDASVLFESLGLESINGFRDCCLLPLPEANTCPLMFLQSEPNTLSC